MKLLYIPLDYHRHEEDDRLFGDFLRGFQKHCEAKIYTNMFDAIAYAPEVIFYQGSLSLEECDKLKRATGAKFNVWTGDVRYAPMQYLMDLRGIADAYFLPFRGALQSLYEHVLGKPCKYIFEPFQDCKLREPKSMLSGNVAFVGNVYTNVPGGNERLEMQRFLKEQNVGIDFYGSGMEKGQVDNNEVPNIYNDAYAVIAENNWHDIEGYFTPRNLTAMAAGSCCIMKYFPGAEKIFKNWHNAIFYRTQYELLDIISFLQKNPEIRNRIAQEGYEYVKGNFLPEHFAYLFLKQAQ